ncbi:MAG: hypothetical protein ACI9AT_001258 [Ulvibacter sp.]|jgi:hypothetical protein
MKQKWYLSTFVLILVLLGYSRHQAYVPNQEIVMQFVDADVTNEVTQNAMAIVKKQLQAIGIANIQVRETAPGRLKVTYYSDLDVASIKRMFSKEISLELGYASLGPIEGGEQDKFPSNKSSDSYNLNVCEIQKSYDAESDFNGHILEITPENERLYNSIVDLSIDKNDVREKNRIEKVAYLIQRDIALAIDNSSGIIPEVRAGPASKTNS